MGTYASISLGPSTMRSSSRNLFSATGSAIDYETEVIAMSGHFAVTAVLSFLCLHAFLTKGQLFYREQLSHSFVFTSVCLCLYSITSLHICDFGSFYQSLDTKIVSWARHFAAMEPQPLSHRPGTAAMIDCIITHCI
jgi:hypothetical protein